MDVALLGSVEVRVGPQRLALGAPRLRLLVAALAVDAGQVVPAAVLLGRLWGEDPPGRAWRTLQTYVTRIRRVVPAVLGRSGGYVLDVDPDAVDVHRFRQLATEAGDTACPGARRLGLLREAVGLWRGVPLTGLPGEWAERVRWSWRQQRIDVVVAWARAEIDAGTPAATLGPLADLADEHPLVEPVAAAQVRALSACGRPAEALSVTRECAAG